MAKWLCRTVVLCVSRSIQRFQHLQYMVRPLYKYILHFKVKWLGVWVRSIYCIIFQTLLSILKPLVIFLSPDSQNTLLITSFRIYTYLLCGFEINYYYILHYSIRYHIHLWLQGSIYMFFVNFLFKTFHHFPDPEFWWIMHKHQARLVSCVGFRQDLQSICRMCLWSISYWAVSRVCIQSILISCHM